MPETALTYLQRGQSGIFAEVYFPRRIATQGQDVLRAILFWIISRQGRLDDVAPWDAVEQERFVKEYEPISTHKKEFVQDYFKRVARETFKWMGDCFLFIFGYLVRQFSEQLTKRGKPEKEIWVTTFFNLTVSVVKKAEQQTLVTQGELQ